MSLASPTFGQIVDIDDPPLDPARDAAERRVEADMIKMNNLVEALARNLGQLHYLRTLCFGEQDQRWRSYTEQMINIEVQDNTERQEDIIQAFNNGYYIEKARFEACTEDVSIDVAAISENARHISNMLGDPYRTP